VRDDAEGDSNEPSEYPNRRSADRFAVAWSVDCETDDTFLYASIRNISELGIFVATREPLTPGTRVTLRFSAPEGDGFVLGGVVQWINPIRLLAENRNPGMGIRFVELTPDDRERLVDSIRTIAYVRDQSN
jgi:type IV pilus assembly protein PilZ